MKQNHPAIPIALCALAFLFSCQGPSSSQGERFLDQVSGNKRTSKVSEINLLTPKAEPRQSAFQSFPSGSVRPAGWIKEHMERDLKTGMVGHLDELYPGIEADDLYRTARRAGVEDVPEMGDLVLTGAEWETSIMWWNAETIGNWWDGFIRHAYLVDDADAKAQADAIIKNLLESQDENGYLGIYKPSLRYAHDGSNGELWAQTTAFRTLLGYYELTGNPEVLAAVERAMAVTMKSYGEEGRSPFELANEFGGATHGLMLTDVCEVLYRITGQRKYLDYAVYLYQEFSKYPVNRAFNDLRLPHLIHEDSAYQGHAVHTYEQIRSLAAAHQGSNHPQLDQAMQVALDRLQPCLLPGGAGHGNEWILKKPADPTLTGAEYCCMLELRNSWSSLLQKTGDIEWADAAEKLTYNGMMGSINAEGTALAYGKTDNCFVLDGHHHEGGQMTPDPRYKYSPTHSEPAVCCVPNYGRNLPYFLDQMWMKNGNDIALLMYGPNVLSTTINDQNLQITSTTSYPFEDHILLKINTSAPTTFTLQLRIPAWSTGLKTSIEPDSIQGGYAYITRTWADGEQLELTLEAEPQIMKMGEEQYIQRGPLVYVRPIPSTRQTIKTYDLQNFTDYYEIPAEPATALSLSSGQLNYELRDGSPTISAQLSDPTQQLTTSYTLIPFGKSVLRQTTFKPGEAHDHAKHEHDPHE